MHLSTRFGGIIDSLADPKTTSMCISRLVFPGGDLELLRQRTSFKSILPTGWSVHIDFGVTCCVIKSCATSNVLAFAIVCVIQDSIHQHQHYTMRLSYSRSSFNDISNLQISCSKSTCFTGEKIGQLIKQWTYIVNHSKSKNSS